VKLLPIKTSDYLAKSVQLTGVVEDERQGETAPMVIKEENLVQSLPASISRSRMKITKSVKDTRKLDNASVETEPLLAVTEANLFQAASIPRQEVTDGKLIDEDMMISKPKSE